MTAPRFLCDAMLGHLARGLRVLGFDATYADSDQADEAVLTTSLQEGRVLLTRDFPLYQRARRQDAAALLLQDVPVEEQLILTMTHLGVDLDPTRFFTRCTLCNGALEPVAAKSLPPEVPQGVREQHTEFTRCPDCGKVYWPGTHVEAMQERLRRVVQELARGTRRESL